MSKLNNLNLLFPKNVLILLLDNNKIMIKGPFGTYISSIFEGTEKDLFFCIKSIKIKYNINSYNQLKIILHNNKINSKLHYNRLLTTIKRLVDLVSNGHLSILQIWGIGYKMLKDQNSLFFFLGHSHSINYNIPKGIDIKPFDGSYLFITGNSKQNVLLETKKIKSLRKKDNYKGKGFRFLNEKIKLKIGKKD